MEAKLILVLSGLLWALQFNRSAKWISEERLKWSQPEKLLQTEVSLSIFMSAVIFPLHLSKLSSLLSKQFRFLQTFNHGRDFVYIAYGVRMFSTQMGKAAQWCST